MFPVWHMYNDHKILKRGNSCHRYLRASLHVLLSLPWRNERNLRSWLYWINVPRLALPGKMDYRATLCQAWQQVGTSEEDICETVSSLALPINTTGRRRFVRKAVCEKHSPLTETNVKTQQMGGKYLVVKWHPVVVNAFHFVENKNSKKFVRSALETNHTSPYGSRDTNDH